MFENVVVGVRGEQDGRDAIVLAKKLASGHGELTLVHVYTVINKPSADSGAAVDAAKRRYVLERLRALADELSVDALVSWVEERSVRRGLHEFASKRHADLLVVAATDADEIARDLVGDDTRRLLEDAPCAVAVAPSSHALRAGPVRRVGVGYDGSPESERALELARVLAAEQHAELSAFEAVEAPIYVHDPENVDGELEDLAKQARQRLAALGGLEGEARVGDAVEELLRYGRSVDLLVMGSHKYRPLDRLLEQSTSQRLADEAASPLLVLSETAHSGRRIAPPRVRRRRDSPT